MPWVKAGRITQTYRIGGGKKSKGGMRMDHFVLIQKCQLAFDFQDPLNDEHHVRAASVIFVKDKSAGMLESPRKQAFTVFGDLLSVFNDDRIFSDEIDPADVAIEIDPDAGPIEPCRHLLDVGSIYLCRGSLER